MGSIAYTLEDSKEELRLDTYRLTVQEKAWLDSISKYHSYFKLELASDNTIKRAYLMDASNAPELSTIDKATYNFERRALDEGVEPKRLKLKEFMKFWNKHLVVGFKGEHGVEYVSGKRYGKIYRCRPFGWVIEEFQSDEYIK